MARQFINMDMDNTNYSGYWWVDFINEEGELERMTFDNDRQAAEFYNVLISERTIPNS